MQVQVAYDDETEEKAHQIDELLRAEFETGEAVKRSRA